jgi:hypothetical protein
MRTLTRYLLILEVAVCYGPGLVALAVGILVTPLWVVWFVAMLVAATFDAKYRHVIFLLEAGLNLVPILLVVGGVLGFTGLFRVLRNLLSTTEDLPYTGQTRAFVLIGIGTVIIFVIDLVAVYIVGTFRGETVHFWPELAPIFALSVPPLFASGHIVYLARRGLFAHDPPRNNP